MSGFCRIKFSINYTNLQGFYFSMNLHHLHNLGGPVLAATVVRRDNGEQAGQETGKRMSRGLLQRTASAPVMRQSAGSRVFQAGRRPGTAKDHLIYFMKLFFTKLFAKHSGCDLVCSCISQQCPEQGQTKVYGKSRAFAGN